MSASAEKIRALNDQFRALGPLGGDWVITPGVGELGPARALEAVDRVRNFASFTADNDPYAEHDFGSFELSGQTLFWKIDYYAPDLQSGSDDPGEPALTRRVLTLMLASEY